MTATEIKLLRESILRVLDANSSIRFGLSAQALCVHLVPFGFRIVAPEAERQLDYLSGAPLEHVAIIDAGGFSPEVRTWKITTRGRNFLAQLGNEQ